MPIEQNPPEMPEGSDKEFLRLPDDTLLEVVEASDKSKRKPRKRPPLYLGYRLRAMLPLILAIIVALLLGFAGALIIVQRGAQPATVPPPVITQIVLPTPDNTASDAQSLLWASAAQKALVNNDVDLGVRLALEANQVQQPYIQVQQALFAAAYAPGTAAVFSPADNIGVNDIVVSPDGKWLAASYFAGDYLRLWDVQNRAVVRSFDTSSLPSDLALGALAFSPDGRYLLAGGNSGVSDETLAPVLGLWDVATGAYIRSFTGHTARVSAVAFSPDGRFILTGSGQINKLEDYSIRLWDVETGKQIRQYDGKNTDTLSLKFTPDGSQFFAATQDDTLTLWDVQTGKPLRKYPTADGNNLVSSVDVSSDDLYALSGSWDQAIRLWDLTTGRMLHQYVTQSTIITSVAFSPDERFAASASFDQSVSLIDLVAQTELSHYLGSTDPVLKVVFSPDGHYLFSGGQASTIRMWSVGSSGRLEDWQYGKGVQSLALSPDQKTILLGLEDGSIRLEDAQTGESIRRFQTGQQPVISVAFSPDGKLAASATGFPENNYTLLNIDTGEQAPSPQGKNIILTSPHLAFSPNGKTLVGISSNKVALWDASSGTVLKTFDHASDGAVDALFSADGSKVLGAFVGGLIDLWDANTGSQLKEFGDYRVDNLQVVTFSPDEQSVLAGYRDGTIILWDINTGQEIRRFKGQSGPIADMAFTPNGQYVLTSSETANNNLILWDAASGEELYRFPGYTERVNSLRLTADGSTLYTASNDGSVQVWYIPQSLDDLKSWMSQNHYIRDFTCDERQEFQITPLCST